MSKLEKVAMRYRKENGRPLVLIFNNVHFMKDDEAGQGILHLIQQRAESWAASQCANMSVGDVCRTKSRLGKETGEAAVKERGRLSCLAEVRSASPGPSLNRRRSTQRPQL